MSHYHHSLVKREDVTTACQVVGTKVTLRSTAVRVQTVYQKDDILAVRHNRRREISPFWLAVLLEDVQIEVDGGNFVQQRVSLKWLNETSDSLTYTSGDVCNGDSPKCILIRVFEFSSDGSDIILTTEEVTGSVEFLHAIHAFVIVDVVVIKIRIALPRFFNDVDSADFRNRSHVHNPLG